MPFGWRSTYPLDRRLFLVPVRQLMSVSSYVMLMSDRFLNPLIQSWRRQAWSGSLPRCRKEGYPSVLAECGSGRIGQLEVERVPAGIFSVENRRTTSVYPLWIVDCLLLLCGIWEGTKNNVNHTLVQRKPMGRNISLQIIAAIRPTMPWRPKTRATQPRKTATPRSPPWCALHQPLPRHPRCQRALWRKQQGINHGRKLRGFGPAGGKHMTRSLTKKY